MNRGEGNDFQDDSILSSALLEQKIKNNVGETQYIIYVKLLIF